jgi:biopolymer transport protein ExbB/TolQ
MKGASHESLGAQQTKGLVMPMNQSKRFLVRFGSVCAGILVVVVLNLVPLRFPGLDLSMILADWRTMIQPDGSETSEHHWFSVQAFLWVTFFLGLGEIWIRRQGVRSEEWLLKIGLLPEDERTMLTSEKLAPIYVRARTTAPDAMLSTLVRRLTMEFRKSVSVDRVNSLLDSSMELLLHQLDLRYTLLRYLVWIIPTLGFLGTVIGIADALEFVGSGQVPPEELLMPTTKKLGVAFHTTLLALIQSSVLMYGLNIIQASEETILNRAGQYCLDNLVIRLAEPAQINKNA